MKWKTQVVGAPGPLARTASAGVRVLYCVLGMARVSMHANTRQCAEALYCLDIKYHTRATKRRQRPPTLPLLAKKVKSFESDAKKFNGQFIYEKVLSCCIKVRVLVRVQCTACSTLLTTDLRYKCKSKKTTCVHTPDPDPRSKKTWITLRLVEVELILIFDSAGAV